MILAPDAAPCLVEVKCVVGHPPATPRVEWLVQSLHQRMVYPEAARHYLVCFGNLQLVSWDVPRHQKAMDRVLREEERFLERIEKQDAPPVRAADAAILGKAWPLAKPEVIELDDTLRDMATRYDALVSSMKAGEDARDLLEAELKSALGEHEKGVFSDGSSITWKTHTRKAHTRTVEAGTYRRFVRTTPNNGGTDHAEGN